MWRPLVALLCLHTLFHSLDGASGRDKEITVDEASLDFLIKALEKFEKRNSGQNADRNRNQDGAADYSSEAAAEAWVLATDAEYHDRVHATTVAMWSYHTNITDESTRQLQAANQQLMDWKGRTQLEGRRYTKGVGTFSNRTVARMLKLFVFGGDVPCSGNPGINRDIAKQMSDMSTIYSTASVVKDGKTYRLDPEIESLMATSRDYDTLLWAWTAFRNMTAPRMKDTYTGLVTGMNTAARESGYPDAGAWWQQSFYEQTDVEPMVDGLWAKLKPLFTQLHAYVRRRLANHYNTSSTGPIPQHLLGNINGQQWDLIFELLKPYPDVRSPDITAALRDQGYTPRRMFHTADKFFRSLGLAPMTRLFWDRSMLVRPAGRDVDCHGSAEDMFAKDDFRIKMCTVVDADHLQTVHHEMGHVQYFMQYEHQPAVYRNGANAAFHEAIGDTIALSVVTQRHLATIGLVDEKDHDTHEHERTINFLMRLALEKVAFLPFAYSLEKWRWAVLRGDVTADNYTAAWWSYRLEAQGVAPPVPRTEADFDPGAKYHIPANVPYIRYFLSFIGQFQFHQALCEAAGNTGPLHNCDIYRSKPAGSLLKSVLELGQSKRWPEAMKLFTGQEQFTTAPILEYFRPLHDWLTEQNKGEAVGWGEATTKRDAKTELSLDDELTAIFSSD